MTEKLDRTLAIRVTEADMARLSEVAEQFSHIVTARALARVAMRLGLEAIAKDPTVIINTPIPKRGGARARPATSTRRKRS
jgi:hypothetical protein